MYKELLYVPNLIGYFRLIMIFAYFYISHSNPILCVFLFVSNHILDFFDGMAARKFN